MKNDYILLSKKNLLNSISVISFWNRKCLSTQSYLLVRLSPIYWLGFSLGGRIRVRVSFLFCLFLSVQIFYNKHYNNFDIRKIKDNKSISLKPRPLCPSFIWCQKMLVICSVSLLYITFSLLYSILFNINDIYVASISY